jgi:hypothetical protein
MQYFGNDVRPTETKKYATKDEMNLTAMRERKVRYSSRPETSRAEYPITYGA